MTVRRKSLWRSANSKRTRKFSNMRAAKERKRLARLDASAAMPPPMPRQPRVKPLFVVTIRCRDGEAVRLRIYDGPHGLSPGATTAARRIAAVLANYRPIKDHG